MVSSSLTVVFLVAVNLIPLFGVLFLGWGLFPIMVLYWLENGIVGFFNLPKIALASAPVAGPGTGGLARPNPLPGLVGRVSLMVFFASTITCGRPPESRSWHISLNVWRFPLMIR